MKRLAVLATLILISATAAFAQDDYKKFEFFAGYSALWLDNLAGDTGSPAVDDVLGEKQNLRGFNVAGVYNFHKYVGAKFDYSLHLREDNFSRPAGSGTIDTTLQNILGGIQVKNNMEDGPTFKPFGHALFGIAVQKVDVDSPNLPALFGINDFHTNETSFAMAFGGGLDIKLNHRIDIRAIQVDWNIINRGDQQTGIVLAPTPFQTVGQPFFIPGTRQDNLRLGVGIVIH
ncbi:MAG TPA: outer membrane beta-barrel protein [Pyrinomonadaceae bacterium]|jgi:opacity protein-like surface antigen|nr:outer membrane beta-barrel protein [Pyrinomonadaceae bacterium]